MSKTPNKSAETPNKAIEIPDKTTKAPKESTKTIEQKIAQLEQATEWFSSDNFRLEDAKSHYESALKLADEIKDDLNSLKNEIEILKI